MGRGKSLKHKPKKVQVSIKLPSGLYSILIKHHIIDSENPPGHYIQNLIEEDLKIKFFSMEIPNLNHLIKKGKEPLKKEYFITYDIPQIGDEQPIPEGTIVTNVRIKSNSNYDHLGYDFTIKETNLPGHTNYPWALAENTSENLILWQDFKEADAEYEKHQQIRKHKLNKLKTLKF